MTKETKKKGKQCRRTEWRMVSLIIAGKYLDPDKVVEALHVIPDDWCILGEPYGKNKKCQQGYWMIVGKPSTGRIETQMKSILKRISSVRQKLKKFIKEEKTVRGSYLTIDISPPEGIPNVCYDFDAELINGFTSLGINIILSINIREEWQKVFASVESKEKKQILKNKKNMTKDKK